MKPKRPKSSRKPSKAPLPTFCDNQQTAAALLKIPVGTVRQAKRMGCPAFRSGRIYLAVLQAWLGENEVEAAPEDVKRRYFAAKAGREELKLQKESGEVLDRYVVERGIASGMAIMFDSLERIFCCELPGRCKGMAEVGIRDAALKAIEDLKVTLRERLGAMAGAEGEV